ANSSQRLFWARAFGGWGSVDGNDEVGKLKRNSGGVMFGADMPVSRWKLGVLGGYSRSSADVDVRNSDSTSNNYHLGAYAGTQIQKVLFRSGLSYSWHNVDTTRHVSLPSSPVFNDHLTADYQANTLQA
ncbi:autotransporter outer membrane beta-barrel domain-containing protein, partial [Neisseriaceae bacterium TC5R-5]|nr:autotransporter outer membrane beta-barrel domain-containing protein [Neisseriaceae bacterium TC5R-5]